MSVDARSADLSGGVCETLGPSQGWSGVVRSMHVVVCYDDLLVGGCLCDCSAGCSGSL